MLNRRVLMADLKAMLETVTGRPVGLSVVPGATDTPYCILYPISAELYGPPFAGPEEDADVEVQITSVGEGPEQAEWLADRARLAILGRSGVAHGFTGALPAYVHSRSSSGGPSGGDGDSDGRIAAVVERFVFHIVGD